MEGRQIVPKSEACSTQECDIDVMWKFAGEVSAPMLMSGFRDSKHKSMELQNQTQTQVSTNMINNPTSYHVVNTPQSSGVFGPNSSELPWSMETEYLDRDANTTAGAMSRALMMDIDDVGFESPFMSFTQCLQSGLQMGPADYSALSRSLGSASATQQAHYNPEFVHGVVEAGAISNSNSQSSSAIDNFPPYAAESRVGGRSGDTSTVPSTPNSSISSSSSEGHDEQSSVVAPMASTSGAKGAAESHSDLIAAEKPSVDSKKQSYYRCTNSKCCVKKRVERSSEDPGIVITTYEGQHSHHSPAMLRGSGSESHFSERLPSAFSQTPYRYPQQMMVQVPAVPRTNFNPAVHTHPDLRTHHQHVIIHDQQRPHSNSLMQPPVDEGLLEDIVPPGMRNISS
eukprot:Gb_08731 [translate_table: standard]